MKGLSQAEFQKFLGSKYSRPSRWLLYCDLLRVSFREVMRKRRRYAGAALSIALGTAGFILIVTMGEDLKKNFNNDLDLLGGVTVINAYYQPTRGQQVPKVRDYSMESIRRLPGVKIACLATVKNGVTMSWHKKSFGFTLFGIEASYWNVFDFKATLGRLFTEEEVKQGKKVCVIGSDTARQIFGGDDQAIGQMVLMDDNLYEVIGVVGGVRSLDVGLRIFLPLPTALARIEGIAPPHSIYIRCYGWDDVEPVAKVLPEILGNNQSDKGLRLRVREEALTHVKRVFWWVELFIYASFSSTLVLGGFSIWNIMMSAVTTRTREIGLKKAMGAQDVDVMLQFLFESLCVTCTSVILGIGIARIGVDYISRAIGSEPQDGLFLICLFSSLFFAAVIGVAAGLYPSIRASRMEVVDAMRFE